MKKYFSIFLLACLILFSFSGCASNTKSADAKDASSEAEESKDSEQKHTINPADTSVGISMPSQSLERWNRDGAFLKNQFESRGYNVELAFADNSYEKQNKDIKKMIDDNVNLLVVAAVDASELSKVLSKAKELSIPVIAYDRLIMDTDAITYYVSYDNYMVGTLQGQYVVDKLKLDWVDGPFNVEFVAGDAGDNNASYYYNGAYDVLKPYIDKGKVVVPSGQIDYDRVITEGWTTDNAEKRFKNILNSFYKDGTRLDAVICANDSTALGVVRALESDYKGKNHVIVTGQDGDEENLAKMIGGKQSMTVFKVLTNEAVVTFAISDEILKGGTPNENLIENSGWDFDCKYDTSSYDNGTGAIQSFLLTPTTVTKDNMKQILVDPGYYTVDEEGNFHAVGK